MSHMDNYVDTFNNYMKHCAINLAAKIKCQDFMHANTIVSKQHVLIENLGNYSEDYIKANVYKVGNMAQVNINDFVIIINLKPKKDDIK